MPTPNQPRRPDQQQVGLGTQLLTRMGDWVDDRVADAGDWADDRAADAKGAALDVATRFQPVANAILSSRKEWPGLKARFVGERTQAQEMLNAEH